MPVRTNGFDHLAVVLGVIQNRVLLADPLFGNHIMLRDSFEGRWLDYDEKTGFALWSRGHENIGFNVGPRDLKGPHNQLGPRASGFIINLRGDAELLLANENAEHLGIIGGRYIDEIPNAELFFDDPLRNRNSSGPNNNYYYFFNNTNLVTKIYGKAAGAFAIEKMTGDKIIHVFNVPTEENVTDRIFLSKEGDFSIHLTANQNAMVNTAFPWLRIVIEVLSIKERTIFR